MRLTQSRPTRMLRRSSISRITLESTLGCWKKLGTLTKVYWKDLTMMKKKLLPNWELKWGNTIDWKRGAGWLEIIHFAPSQLILTIIFLIVSTALLQCDPLEMEIKAGQLAGQFVLINFLWKLWLTISVDPERRATRKLATAVELKALKACNHKYESKLRELRRTAIPQFVSLNLNIFNWNTS